MKALAKEPRDRFQSMDEFRKALIGEVKLADVPGRSVAVRTAPMPATTTLSQKASTTLSSASSEIDDALQPAGGRNRKVIGAVGALAAVAVIAFVVMPKSHDKPALPQAALPAPTPVAPPPPVAPPAAKTVMLRFEAEPSGAHLFAKVDGKKDGKDLGEIPVELELPKGTQSSDYLFRLAGYREVSLTARPNADRTLHVSLEKIAAAPAPTAEASKHHPAPHHGAARKKSPVDEDGLATPSF